MEAGEEPQIRPPWWKQPLGKGVLVVVGCVLMVVITMVSDQWDWIAAGMQDPPEVLSVLPPDPAPGHDTWGVEWVTLPKGSFEMVLLRYRDLGSNEAQPVHTVTVPPFQLMRTEVTVAMYQACVAAKRCAPPAQEGKCTYYEGLDQHPVNCVAWEQARVFCSAAGGRLPTEAEWQYAATGGGERRRFPWGAKLPSAGGVHRANFNGYNVHTNRMIGRRDRDGFEHTAPVCSFPEGRSREGLCDMAGNLGEWIEDCFHETYDGAPTDGSAWITDCRLVAWIRNFRGYPSHVLRGGSLHSWAGELQSALHVTTAHDDDGPGVGVRCARDLPADASAPNGGGAGDQ